MKHQRMKTTGCTLLAVLLVILCSLLAAPALAASNNPTIAVAPFTSTQKTKQKRLQAQRARTAIVKALGDTGKSEFLSWTTVTNRAKRQYIKGAALENPKRVGPVVKRLGGDVLVFGSIDKKGKLTLTITDTAGKKLWVKSVPLKQGKLSPTLAKKFAKAIDAAAKAATAGKPSKKPAAAPPPPDDSSDEEIEQPKPKKKQPKQTQTSAAKASSDDEEEEVDEWGRPKKRHADNKRVQRRSDDDQDEDDSWGRSKRKQSRNRDDEDDDADDSWNKRSSGWGSAKSDDDGYRSDPEIGPAILKINADLSMTFRKYKFCNGVTSCGDVPVAGAGHSVDFSTSTPYLGFQLGLELFPAARVRNRYLRGIGIVGGLRMNPGISVSYTIGETENELNGKEIDFNVAATYRFYYNAGFLKNAWFGIELGYMRYGFTIDENPFFSSSSHGGFAVGLDVGLPLHRYVSLDLNFTFQPSTSPGDDERKFFAETGDTPVDPSEISANGKGLKFDVGLEFPFSRYIGLNVKFDFARYWSDFERYATPSSSDVIPATASEQYIGISVGLTGKF